MTKIDSAPPAGVIGDAARTEFVAEDFGPHLVWLSRLHYLLAALTAAFAPAGIYLAVVGWQALHDNSLRHFDPRQPPLFDPLLWSAALFMTGGVLATLCLVHGSVLWHVGRCLAERRRRRWCLVFSVFDLTYVPLGFLLSIYVLVVLTRPGVKSLFHS